MGRVDEVMGEVLADARPELAAVARAVRDVNETHAVHAAWTDERFETMDDRLVQLARIGVMASSKIEVEIAKVDARLVGFGVGQLALGRTVSTLEHNHVAVMQRLETVQQGIAALEETMRRLTTKLGEILTLAVSAELKTNKFGADEPT